MNGLQSLGIYELFPRDKTQSKFSEFVCGYVSVICENLLKLVAGSDQSYNNKDRYKLFLNHYPSGTSWRNANHLKQNIEEKKFMKYKYGPALNMYLYGSMDPPEYDFNKIDSSIPIGLLTGKYDLLGDPQDCYWLQDQLENVGVLKYHKQYKAGHLTFFLPKDYPQFVDDTVKFIKEYANN